MAKPPLAGRCWRKYRLTPAKDGGSAAEGLRMRVAVRAAGMPRIDRSLAETPSWQAACLQFNKRSIVS
jgi:hypothetical protein